VKTDFRNKNNLKGEDEPPEGKCVYNICGRYA
jgi:hypothetical protein